MQRPSREERGGGGGRGQGWVWREYVDAQQVLSVCVGVVGGAGGGRLDPIRVLRKALGLPGGKWFGLRTEPDLNVPLGVEIRTRILEVTGAQSSHSKDEKNREP